MELTGPNDSQALEAGDVQKAKPASLTRLTLASMVAAGMQYGWALQIALLTSYVQTLGLSHSLSSLMWLCGPIAGLFVQPPVAAWSDKCHSRFGRRRPFLLVGCLLICASVIIIAFSSDIGYALGDTKEHCRFYTGKRWKAIIVYVAGFWMLDFSNNAILGPSRALMADLAGPGRFTAANAIMCSWLGFGNILGYASGMNGSWHRWFPFLNTRACCEACANLKGAFLVEVVFLLFCLSVSLISAKEVPLEHNPSGALGHDGGNAKGQTAGVIEILRSFKHLPPGMPSLLCVNAITWTSWFPFFLYNTDWMGREIYHGDPNGSIDQRNAYYKGVRYGSFGLLMNSIVLGVSSFLIEPLCRRLTTKAVWVISNFTMFLSMAAIIIVSLWSTNNYSYHGVQQIAEANGRVKTVAVLIFAFLGFPLSVLFSVPAAVTAQLAAPGGYGQGVCLGILNISIVIPQIIIALSAGPWDALFHKGNLPSYSVAAALAFAGIFAAFFMLPKLSKSSFESNGLGGPH